MWRLLLKAGEFFLTKEAVPKGATELSKHASKKAGQAALKEAQSVTVKKVPKGSAVRKSLSPESKEFGRDIERANIQRTKDFADKTGTAKAKKIQENRRKAMEKSQRTKKEAKQMGVEETRPGGAEGLRGMRRAQYDEWTGGQGGFAGGGTVPSKKKKTGGRAKSDTDKAKQNRKDYAKNPQMFLDQPGKKAKSISPIARKKKTGDARKALKVHPMLAAARKRKSDIYPITLPPERPKLVYKKGKGIYSNSVRSPNW